MQHERVEYTSVLAPDLARAEHAPTVEGEPTLNNVELAGRRRLGGCEHEGADSLGEAEEEGEGGVAKEPDAIKPLGVDTP